MHKKAFLFYCSCILSLTTFSQQNRSDFISFKKKGRTMANYFKGMPLEFIHINGSYVNGIINHINNDTVFMVFYDVKMMPTYWGTGKPDTMARYDMRFHYEEIGAIPRQPGTLAILGSNLLMVGGTTYAFLHTFNGLIKKERIDIGTLAISGGVALSGFAMKKLRKYEYPIGKKYTINYVKLAD